MMALIIIVILAQWMFIWHFGASKQYGCILFWKWKCNIAYSKNIAI